MTALLDSVGVCIYLMCCFSFLSAKRKSCFDISGAPQQLVSVWWRKRELRYHWEQPREIIVFMLNFCPGKSLFSCLCWATSAQMRRRIPWIMIVAPPGHRMRSSLSLTSPSGHRAACETGLDRCMLGKRSSPKSGTLWALSPCRESHCSPLKPAPPPSPIGASWQKWENKKFMLDFGTFVALEKFSSHEHTKWESTLAESLMIKSVISIVA